MRQITPETVPKIRRPIAPLFSRKPLLQRKCTCGGVAGPDGECAECRKKREAGVIQRQSGPSGLASRSLSAAQPSFVPARVRDTLRSPGWPLEPATRAALEPRFDHDFSEVRIHTDPPTARSARDVNALAYTVGRDVVFADGQYSPGTASGRALLAHELAHVMQQGGAAFDPGGPLRIDSPGSSLEREVETAGARATGPTTSASAAGLLQRTEDTSSGGKKNAENECSGWFADHESMSKRAAELYVRTELTGKRGVVTKIDCDLTSPDGAFGCTVTFSDGTPIRVIVRHDSIVVGVAPLKNWFPPADRPLCWYGFKCPGPNRDLVLTKIKCQSAPKPSAPPANASKDLNA